MNFLSALQDKAIGVAIGGMIALLFMWKQLALVVQTVADLKKDRDKHADRLDDHEKRLGQQDTILARIDEGVSWIKEALKKSA